VVSDSAPAIPAKSTADAIAPALLRYATPLTLLLILVLGGLLRLTNADWDDGQNLHPDERFLTMVATEVQWPDGIRGYLDSQTSPLNPYNVRDGDGNARYPTFIYGTFPLVIGKWWGELTGNDQYGSYHLASRSLSAIVDLFSILLLFLIGRRLFGDTVALLGALLYTLSVLPIQLSHFGTFDNWVTAFCLGAFYFALRANDRGRWWDFALSGVLAGLAIASKLSALPIIAVTALPLIEQMRIHGIEAFWRKPSKQGLPALLGVALAVVAAIWTFRFAQPYAFASGNPLNFSFDPRWTRDVEYWRAIQSGDADAPPSVQWANRPLSFITRNLVLWGMGPALGIAALAGLGFASLRAMTAKRLPPTWLLVLIGWPAFHLVYYSVAFTRTMRYVIPAYPFLALLAAAGLMALYAWGRDRWPKRDWLFVLPAVAVVTLTAFYAIAFSSIYTKPTTRVAASEWIYNNVPEGTVALEHWDDPLPLNLPGYPGSGAFPGQQMPNYDPDNAEKLSRMVDILEQSDWLFLSSNRLYDSITRMPEKYPMTIEYYRMLFSGELGFELVETFASHPELFGIELNDDNAEEAFSVYDHPKVLAFRKTADFDADRVATHLATFLNQEIANIRTVNAGYYLLQFDEEELAVQQAGGTWSDLFDPDSLSNRYPVVAWYLALQLMALAAVPLCWKVLKRLPDRGYAVSKTIGLLGAATIAWLLASFKIMSFGGLAVFYGILAMAALSVIATGGHWRRIWDDLKPLWRSILVAEVLFLAAFLFFVWLRWQNPDLWHPARGGEKPMEFAYFNAVLRSTHFPPYDPWFAGGYLNYYYFGWVILGSLTRLTAIVPETAFQLAVATCFALTVLNAWSVASTSISLLSRHLKLRSLWWPLGLGVIGSFFVAVIGNLDMARRFGAGEWGFQPTSASGLLSLGHFGDIARGVVRAVANPRSLPTDAFWTPTRLIDGTINEFPYFSFLFADLHPHMMSIPFTIAALVVALGMLCSSMWPDQRPSSVEPDEPAFGLGQSVRSWVASLPRSELGERAALVVLAAAVTGALYPINTWDYPTYLLITGGTIFLVDALGSAVAATSSGTLGWRISFAVLRRAAVTMAAVVVLGRLIYLPFISHYQVPNSGFDPWLDRSAPDTYLIIHGLFLFVIGSYIVADLLNDDRSHRFTLPLPSTLTFGSNDAGDSGRAVHVETSPVEIRWSLSGLIAIMLVLLGGISLWADSISGMLVAMIALVTLEVINREREPAFLFLCGLTLAALFISFGVEHYTLRGDIGRMNTVFKFYLQVWVLLGLAAAVFLVLFLDRLRRQMSWFVRGPWLIVFAVLVAASLVYPVYATSARLDDRFSDLPGTLDGMAYMDEATFVDGPDGLEPSSILLLQDRVAIDWLRENVEGSPVVLEAVTPLYRWGSRVSVYTGLPTVIGWDWHQTQQRPGMQNLIDQRKADVATIFGETRSFESIRPLLDRYGVAYIYVGPLERAYYPESALAKFDEAVANGLLELVYDQNGVKIFRYNPGSP
jgi:YYY domain-containing protein